MRRDADAGWSYRLKLSEQAIKISNPGVLQVRRFYRNGEAIGDLLFNEVDERAPSPLLIDPGAAHRRHQIPTDATHEDLLRPVFRQGEEVGQLPTLPEIRERTIAQLGTFHPGIRRFVNPHEYPVGLEPKLHRLKNTLIAKARGIDPADL
ncbi:MAG: hypothetical protein ACLFU2_11315 [Opitutales bacterium]